MSVIVEMPIQDSSPHGEYMFTKEADKVMFELENSSLYKTDINSVDINTRSEGIKRDIDYFSLNGLRTLAYGLKRIQRNDYEQWYKDFNELKLNIEITQELKDNRQANLINKIEMKLETIGATGLEDQLQEEVPDCIQDFRRAGIKVWMLTGDIQEIAQNIGYSCKLFSNSTHISN